MKNGILIEEKISRFNQFGRRLIDTVVAVMMAMVEADLR